MKNRPPVQFEARGEITHVNLRMEKHGEDNAAACDVTFSLMCDESILSVFTDAPDDLNHSLFDDVLEPVHNIKPIKWAVELEEQQIDIEYKRAGKSVTRTLPVKAIKKFATEPKPGKHYKLSFQAQLADTKDIDSYIHAWERGSVKVTLFEPEQLNIPLGASQNEKAA